MLAKPIRVEVEHDGAFAGLSAGRDLVNQIAVPFAAVILAVFPERSMVEPHAVFRRTLAVERHRILIVKPVHRGGHVVVIRGIHIVELGVEYINRVQHAAGHGVLPQFAQRKNALILGERRALAQLGGGGDIEHLDAEGVDDGLHGVGYRAGLRGKYA